MLDWSFARRPKWIASHLFVGSLLVVFLWAGFWQLSRLDQRRALNQAVVERSTLAPVDVGDALAGLHLGRVEALRELDYLAVRAEGRYLDGELVRVANRSQNGFGGDWVIGLFETVQGDHLLVNRGFADREEDAAAAPDDQVVIEGWVRLSQTKDGFFGATDTGQGERVPRLDVAAVGERLPPTGPSELLPMWLQASGPATDDAPDPVPLPPIGEGSHFSYALQWFTFAVMGLVVYGLVLRRSAGVLPGVDSPVEGS
ncbi:MAG: SURF1 family protein [Actinomycetota bacterium]|nr:SURF1 family protein [Actinomycetota bacterium]